MNSIVKVMVPFVMKFLFIKLSVLILLITIPFIGFSQKYIRGVVLEESKKGQFTPLTGAPVFWMGTQEGTVTDSSGVFKLKVSEHIEMGHLEPKLVVSYVGYKSDTVFVKDMEKVRVVLVEEGSKELQEVEVTHRNSSSFVNALEPINTKTMTEKELFKAACCNLSESFETNPAIDVSFADAVSGAKQIQMLGLSGIYTQLTQENLPGTRGLAANYGLGYTPGPWVESIQVTKGVGSVANGYESISGQINVELKKSEVTTKTGEKVYANAYVNEMGRAEANLDLTRKFSPKWSSTLLTHANQMGTIATIHTDRNNDGFYDIPNGYQVNLLNRWKYEHNNWIAQFGARVLKDERTGGQTEGVSAPFGFAGFRPYSININQERAEGFAKLGYVFPEKKYKSVGLMVSALTQNQDYLFGIRTYSGKQRTLYANFIYQSIIGNTNHKYRAGISYLFDDYDESYRYTDTWSMKRTESVPGLFAEYTWTILPKITMIYGLRADYHNLFGWFITPRFHGKYDITEITKLRISAGRGQRTANVLAENTGILASSRNIYIQNYSLTDVSVAPKPVDYQTYGLKPEVAWNYGASLTQDFSLFSRAGSVTADFYRTDFQNQVVVDMDVSPQQLRLYNLSGISYSNSAQVEVDYEMIDNLDVRLAYRYYDVKTDYSTRLLQKPLLSQNRAFVNLAYETNNKWKFDLTINWNGKKRIPNTITNPGELRKEFYSPDFFTFNAQMSKSFGNSKKQWWDLYLGVENLSDFRQKDLINAANNPYGPYFDASLIWGPIIGRMVYAGFRYKLK